MNRPKRENYKSHIEYDEYGAIEFNGIDDYYDALEKYCDKLEKALDAACYSLERFDNICHSIYPMTKEQWKEWLMED